MHGHGLAKHVEAHRSRQRKELKAPRAKARALPAQLPLKANRKAKRWGPQQGDALCVTCIWLGSAKVSAAPSWQKPEISAEWLLGISLAWVSMESDHVPSHYCHCHHDNDKNNHTNDMFHHHHHHHHHHHQKDKS